MQITAQVEAIDHETRVVSVRGPQDNILTFTASEEARNLGQVEVGDLINALYVQNLSIELYDNPDQAQPTGGELAGLALTEEGDMPGIDVFDAQVLSATVEEINLETNTFKLKWPDGAMQEYVARDPENLKRANVGDLVVITQTERLAISVQETEAE